MCGIGWSPMRVQASRVITYHYEWMGIKCLLVGGGQRLLSLIDKLLPPWLYIEMGKSMPVVIWACRLFVVKKYWSPTPTSYLVTQAIQKGRPSNQLPGEHVYMNQAPIDPLHISFRLRSKASSSWFCVFLKIKSNLKTSYESREIP